jgi:hypothetical protein
MSHTLTLSDELYHQLEVEAQNRGLDSVERLLAEIGSTEELRQERRETVRRIDSLRERLRKEYGELPDSMELLRADRSR